MHDAVNSAFACTLHLVSIIFDTTICTYSSFLHVHVSLASIRVHVHIHEVSIHNVCLTSTCTWRVVVRSCTCTCISVLFCSRMYIVHHVHSGSKAVWVSSRCWQGWQQKEARGRVTFIYMSKSASDGNTGYLQCTCTMYMINTN